MKRLLVLAAIAAVLAPNALQAQGDPFAEGVRPTDALTPAQEGQAFQLPPGFEIQLVAAEPDIAKPINMAFDAKGRLWVTVTLEYPFPAPLDKPSRDSIKILEDFDANGRARKITTFVDNLNIPTGLMPYKNGVIAWSIPNIWFFSDTDGDGKADKREKLFGPLGWERDTHGMDSSFRRGLDGWLYSTHGFNNNTTIKATDGSEITMNSGNTYRVRVDGSRVEQHTFGQVNPFGLCLDPLGNMYSADCHSAPIYLLLRGAYYPSFGKPHDGLGFAPTLMEHSHGSTAIAGIVYYSDNIWPDEFQNNMFIGNVMTSRVNRDRMALDGSGKKALEQPDFISTKDPWFRPVDLQMGPDGALYIADFYNKIIGHYEVPLLHPGRDRERGRIWRVAYKGQTRPMPDLTKAAAAQIIAQFADANLTRRTIAQHELTDRLGKSAAPELRAALNATANPSTWTHALWALRNLGELDEALLAKAVTHTDAAVRTHAMRILAEDAAWTDARRNWALHSLHDADVVVRRIAAEALGLHPDAHAAAPLLAYVAETEGKDVYGYHTARIALRNALKNPETLNALVASHKDKAQRAAIASVISAVKTEAAGGFLLDYLAEDKPAASLAAQYLTHAVRNAPADKLPKAVGFARERLSDNPEVALGILQSILEGLQQRGVAVDDSVRSLGKDVVQSLLSLSGEAVSNWQNVPVPGMPASPNPWIFQKRPFSDGSFPDLVFSSLPEGGEAFTGILRSKAFTVPASLSFSLAGHDGFPDKASQGLNLIRLMEVGSQKVLAQTLAPRNDAAQRIKWDLAANAGKQAYIELQDSDTGSAFAWIAAGRFDAVVPALPKTTPRDLARQLTSAAELSEKLSLKELSENLRKAAAQTGFDQKARARLVAAVVRVQGNEEAYPLAAVAVAENLTEAISEKSVSALLDGSVGALNSAEAEIFKAAPSRVQTRLASEMVTSRKNAARLLDTVQERKAPASLLAVPTVRDRLQALGAPELATRMAALVKDLPPANEAAQKVIDQRRNAFNPAVAQAAAGREIFEKNCAVCHRIGATGNLVGPQLDGVGGRGLERLCEDILDPNRNVDSAFRSHLLLMKDGDVISGLPRRDEGEVLVIADSTGKETSVQKKLISENRESQTSLMPENFADAIPEADFQNLLAFLLATRGK